MGIPQGAAPSPSLFNIYINMINLFRFIHIWVFFSFFFFFFFLLFLQSWTALLKQDVQMLSVEYLPALDMLEHYANNLDWPIRSTKHAI